ncbi:MAG: hypothetical protein IJ736_11295 [Firmicutes bacterium]|nr:hypothetical protein [Bacillota bacterium]
MKYTYDSNKNIAVLYASRSELGIDGTGKKAFAGFYNRMTDQYKYLAEKYSVPLNFGHRSATRISQFDLLRYADFVHSSHGQSPCCGLKAATLIVLK